MVGLVDDHHLEPLLGRLINLLRLSHLLQQVLDDDSVVVANVGRGDFEVVDGGDNVELEFAVAARLKHTRIDLDLLDARAVQLLERSDNPRLLAGA